MYKKAKVTHMALTKVTDVLRTENLLFNFGGIEGELYGMKVTTVLEAKDD